MAELLFYGILIVAALMRYCWRSTAEIAWVKGNVFAGYDALLTRHMTYYTKLTASGKQKFVAGVHQLVQHLRIEGREGFVVTEEVRILICACLNQLTFGFSEPGLPFLKGVLVYPGVFYSRLARNWVKGLALGNGVVYISWPDFLKGYEHADDTYNLGLHEFTHILKMQSEDGLLSDKRFYAHYEEWSVLAYPVFSKTRNSSEGFFRQYAGTNESEFFSVCVENFFEIPGQFEKELPHLYYHLCYLLNQNPLKPGADYELSEAEIREINTRLKHNLPVNRTLVTSREHRFWLFAARLLWGVALVELFVLIRLSAHTQLVVLRMVIVTAVIFLAARFFYYRNMYDTFHRSYFSYFLFRLLPLLLVAMLMICAVS